MNPIFYSEATDDLVSPQGDQSHIKFSALKFEEPPVILGKGSFGTVYKCNYHGTDIAVKEVVIGEQGINKQIEFYHEVNMLKALKHPNVVLFMGVSKNENKMYIVQELFLNGSLYDILQKKEKELSYGDRSRMCLDVGQALLYMHKRDCLHRDLKSENVLMDSNRCKLADFGLSRLFTRNGTPMSNVGSPWWRAPEVQTGIYGPPADVFSFGVLLLEVLTRLRGEDIRVAMTYQKKIPGCVVFGVKPRVLLTKLKDELEQSPPDFVELAMRCCDESPEKRPTTEEVVEMLSALNTAINVYEEAVRVKFKEQTMLWTASSAEGCKIWMELTTCRFRLNVSNIEAPLATLLDKLDARMKDKTSVKLLSVHKVFLASILGESDITRATIQLDKFALFWEWYYKTEAAILHCKILPLWKAGFIYGFVSKNEVDEWLGSLKKNGVFIVRFSTSQPGSLAINCYYGDRVNKPILLEFDAKKSVFLLGEHRCRTIKEALTRNNLDKLTIVYPDQEKSSQKFLQAHREVELSSEEGAAAYSHMLKTTALRTSNPDLLSSFISEPDESMGTDDTTTSLPDITVNSNREKTKTPNCTLDEQASSLASKKAYLETIQNL